MCIYECENYYKYQLIKQHKHHSQLTSIVSSIKVHNSLAYLYIQI